MFYFAGLILLDRSRWASNASLLSRNTDQGHIYFVVDDVDTFYEKYIRMGARDPTLYETIRGSLPCRLYFDIEFDAILNPNADGEKSMTIIQDCCSSIHK